MATIGLCIITRTPKEAAQVWQQFGGYFDETYIQVNGEGGAGKYNFGAANVSEYKWNNNFADARNALLAEVKTDYWMWIDTDDTIEHPENIRALVEQMEEQGIDKMLVPYEYAKNDIGEEVGLHPRERIIRTSHPYQWVGAVHETLISPVRDKVAKTDEITVLHHKTQADFDASIKRNHKILETEYNKEPRDPRITMYLGMSYFTMREWDKANDLLLEHIRTSGSIDDKYRSWIKVAECHGKVGELNKSISACLEAVKLLPNWPDAYFALGQFYYELGDYDRCLEWLKIGAAKPDPKTFGIIDPTLRYRSIMMGALAELQRGHVKDAWELINSVLAASPDYPLANKYLPLFEEAYLESEAIEHAKWLVTYAHNHKGDPLYVLKALPTSLSLDIRLNGVRNKLYPPKVWPKKSIVFFCGQTGEAWGPDVLARGMGGSEEAVIYLSRELTKRGWRVTVFCERDDTYDDGGVTYLPWHTFNPTDKFDVLVAWRSPSFFSAAKVSARLKCVDLHDTPLWHQEVREQDVANTDMFFFKSQMQREMAPRIPDNKVAIISNGIVREQFA